MQVYVYRPVQVIIQHNIFNRNIANCSQINCIAKENCVSLITKNTDSCPTILRKHITVKITFNFRGYIMEMNILLFEMSINIHPHID